jgi:hypothetical protein
MLRPQLFCLNLQRHSPLFFFAPYPLSASPYLSELIASAVEPAPASRVALGDEIGDQPVTLSGHQAVALSWLNLSKQKS